MIHSDVLRCFARVFCLRATLPWKLQNVNCRHPLRSLRAFSHLFSAGCTVPTSDLCSERHATAAFANSEGTKGRNSFRTDVRSRNRANKDWEKMDSVNSQNYNQFGYTLTRFLWVIPVIPDQIYNSIMHFFTIIFFIGASTTLQDMMSQQKGIKQGASQKLSHDTKPRKSHTKTWGFWMYHEWLIFQSHWFSSDICWVLGGVINPIVGVYIPIVRIPIKGGMTINFEMNNMNRICNHGHRYPQHREFRPWHI